jgi:hypothetical protein
MDSKYVPQMYNYQSMPNDCDVLILAAGFEERSYEFLSKSIFNKDAHCILIKFQYDIPENNEIYTKYVDRITECFDASRIYEVELNQSSIRNFDKDLELIIPKLPRMPGKAWIDISGMPSHAICSTLRVFRDSFPQKEQVVIYTSAKEYFPTKSEFNKHKKKRSSAVEFLPQSMAMEMSEILITESFSGHRSKEGISCLVIFAGYDVHRSAGVIDLINPSALLLLYGSPGGQNLDWRLEMSQQLHNRFESTRKCATEVVSTLNMKQSLDVLEEYYKYLYEDYDLTISPVCSKMQAVSCYLFWEKYREIQLVFPLPIGYLTDKSPKGIGKTYKTILPTRSSLFRGLKSPSE